MIRIGSVFRSRSISNGTIPHSRTTPSTLCCLSVHLSLFCLSMNWMYLPTEHVSTTQLCQLRRPIHLSMTTALQYVFTAAGVDGGGSKLGLGTRSKACPQHQGLSLSLKCTFTHTRTSANHQVAPRLYYVSHWQWHTHTYTHTPKLFLSLSLSLYLSRARALSLSRCLAFLLSYSVLPVAPCYQPNLTIALKIHTDDWQIDEIVFPAMSTCLRASWIRCETDERVTAWTSSALHLSKAAIEVPAQARTATTARKASSRLARKEQFFLKELGNILGLEVAAMEVVVR